MEYRWRALGAVGFGLFMATMDFGIVNLALPRLAADLAQPPDVVVWAALSHSLVMTGATLTAGRAGDLFGRRRVYLTGWCVFGVGLVAASLTRTIETLVAARLLQACGMSMAIANSNAIVLDAFPDRERGRALGIVTAIVGAGLMSGPAVGGFILTGFEWPAIFWLRIPIVAIAIAVGWRYVRESGGVRDGSRLDVPGAIALFVALASLLVAINRGGSWGWASPRTLGLAAAGLATLALFARLESRSGSPILSLHLFRTRNFAVSVGSLIFTYMAHVSVLFALPFYLMDVRGFPAASSGLIVTAVPLMLLLFAPLSGLLFDRHGSRAQATLGLVCVGLGVLSLAWLDEATPLSGVLLPLALVGLGMSVFGPANSSTIFAGVPREAHGTAGASIATSRNIGSALGLGIYSVVLVRPARLVDGVSDVFGVAALLALVAVLASAQRGSTRAGSATR